MEILSVLGIEAARQAMYNEIRSSLNNVIIHIYIWNYTTRKHLI